MRPSGAHCSAGAGRCAQIKQINQMGTIPILIDVKHVRMQIGGSARVLACLSRR
jgi:hypothetical protein